MHIYVNLNSFGEQNKSEFCDVTKPLASTKFRHVRSRIVTLSHEQESTISCLSRARQRSYYANSINSFAVSDTRIKGIDALERVRNTLSVSPSDTREYLREVLLVVDTSPIILKLYTADCITLRGTPREAQWNKSPWYPFDFIRAQFPSSSIRSASRSSQSRSEWIFLFRTFLSSPHPPYCEDSSDGLLVPGHATGKAMEKKSFFIAPPRLSLSDRRFWISMRRCGIYRVLSVHSGGFPFVRNLYIDRWLFAFFGKSPTGSHGAWLVVSRK